MHSKHNVSVQHGLPLAQSLEAFLRESRSGASGCDLTLSEGRQSRPLWQDCMSHARTHAHSCMDAYMHARVSSGRCRAFNAQGNLSGLRFSRHNNKGPELLEKLLSKDT